jgi:hypothetical protein
MGLMEKPPLFLRTTVLYLLGLQPKLAVVCPDVAQSQIAIAQLLGYRKSIGMTHWTTVLVSTAKDRTSIVTIDLQSSLHGV